MGLFGKKTDDVLSQKEERARREKIIRQLSCYVVNWSPRFQTYGCTDEDNKISLEAKKNIENSKTYLEYLTYAQNSQVKLYAERISCLLKNFEKYYNSPVGRDGLAETAKEINSSVMAWARL